MNLSNKINFSNSSVICTTGPSASTLYNPIQCKHQLSIHELREHWYVQNQTPWLTIYIRCWYIQTVTPISSPAKRANSGTVGRGSGPVCVMPSTSVRGFSCATRKAMRVGEIPYDVAIFSNLKKYDITMNTNHDNNSKNWGKCNYPPKFKLQRCIIRVGVQQFIRCNACKKIHYQNRGF